MYLFNFKEVTSLCLDCSHIEFPWPYSWSTCTVCHSQGQIPQQIAVMHRLSALDAEGALALVHLLIYGVHHGLTNSDSVLIDARASGQSLA